MSLLPRPPDNSHPPLWDHWRHDLWTRAQQDPPTRFMSWPCIYHTMLVNHFPMQRQIESVWGDWERWGAVVAPPLVGEPMDYAPGDGRMSLSLVEQAVHLQVWENVTGKRIQDQHCIYEFGGGYGAMALVVHRLGFKGEYYIRDYPEFVLLQQWFLAKHGATVQHVGNPPQVEGGVFIGAYSISEMPFAGRARWMRPRQVDSMLIVYSPRFDDLDNIAWFQDYADKHGEFDWHGRPVADRVDQYLIGVRRP